MFKKVQVTNDFESEDCPLDRKRTSNRQSCGSQIHQKLIPSENEFQNTERSRNWKKEFARSCTSHKFPKIKNR